METVEMTRERERKKHEERKKGNNYLVGGENRKHTIQEKKTNSFSSFLLLYCM